MMHPPSARSVLSKRANCHDSHSAGVRALSRNFNLLLSLPCCLWSLRVPGRSRLYGAAVGTMISQPMVCCVRSLLRGLIRSTVLVPQEALR
jgi:hypothetical protein